MKGNKKEKLEVVAAKFNLEGKVKKRLGDRK